jgi:hypothetical protein
VAAGASRALLLLLLVAGCYYCLLAVAGNRLVFGVKQGTFACVSCFAVRLSSVGLVLARVILKLLFICKRPPKAATLQMILVIVDFSPVDVVYTLCGTNAAAVTRL